MRRTRHATITTAVATGLSIVGQLLAASPVAALTPQTITFELPASDVAGSAIDLSATATSGLAVTFVADTPGTCAVDGVQLSLTAPGTCTVIASQAGDATWEPAPDVTRSMTVDEAPPPPPDPQPQTITFTLPAAGHRGGTVPLNGSASSGLGLVYLVQTPTICSSDGTTLALNAAGTCTVEASQPGDTEWLPADPVTSSIEVRLPPFVTNDGANLGRYAVNGPIEAIEIHPTTGLTYVAGPFTRIGARTGSVALVNGPGSGRDTLVPASPDIIGSEMVAFGDDASHYFLTGQVGSIGGDGIQRPPVIRMHANGTRDAGWTLKATCGDAADLPNWLHSRPRWDLGGWLALPVELGDTTGGQSTIGLALIDKATGIARRTGAGVADCGSNGRTWATTGVFAPLAECATWAVCGGGVLDAVADPVGRMLYTHVFIDRGQTQATQERPRHYLVAYDLDTGARRWSTRLESATAPDGYPHDAEWGASLQTMVGLGDAVLLSGYFPLEPVIRPGGDYTTLMLLEATSGTIVQRWGSSGEQDPADPYGDPVAPVTACTPTARWAYELWRFVPLPTGEAVGYGTTLATGSIARSVCRYALAGTGAQSHLDATPLGSFVPTPPPTLESPLPSTLVDGRYLAGPYDAFDLETGEQLADWRPTPSDSSQISVAAVGSDIVLAGSFTFLDGGQVMNVAALDADLAPVPGFASALTHPGPTGLWVKDMALVGDRVVLVGRLSGEFGSAAIVALDASTGEVVWHARDGEFEFGFTIAADPVSGGFYASFEGTAPFFQRYLPQRDGFVADATFAPTLAGVGAQPPTVTGLAVQDGHLYVGGPFTAIAGQPRQGLARFTLDGTLDAWSPDLIDELAAPDGAVVELQPRGFLVSGDRVAVTGSFQYIVWPGGFTYQQPGMLVYSKTTGTRVRPAVGGASWFGSSDTAYGYDIALVGTSVYVALGHSGIAAFDPTTFDYQPYRSIRTWSGWGNTTIHALAARNDLAPLGIAAETGATLIAGGELTRWRNHTASNVVGLSGGALVSDRSVPTTGSVTARPRSTKQLTGAAAPFVVAWTGKDTGGAGVARYELARSRDGGAWTTVSVSLTTPSADIALTSGSTYRFRVRAVDRVGNIGAWAYSAVARVALVQQTAATYSGSWATSSSSVFTGGSARWAKAAGAAATFRFTGRAVGFVTTAATTRGNARIYVDGALVATVDLRSSTTKYRYVAWQRAWTSVGTHTVRIVVLGTAGRPRVDVDAFVTWR